MVTSILSLSNELLITICKNLECDLGYCSLENFSRTCRRVRDMARHLLLKHSYNRVGDEGVPEVLKICLTELPVHIKTLAFYEAFLGSPKRNKEGDEESGKNGYDENEHGEYCYPRKTRHIITSNMSLFSAAVKRFMPNSIQQRWIDAISNFNSEALLVLLICSGAMIEELDWEFHRRSEVDFTFQNNVWETSHDHPDRNFYLFNYLRDTASRPKERPRMCVKAISLRREMGYDTGDVLDGDEAGMLLTMQNLQSLKMSEVAAWGSVWYWGLTSGEEEELFACNSKLKTLDITGCCFDAEAMQKWVSSLAELTELSCSLSPISFNHSTGEGEPHEIVAAIQKGAGKNLTTLSLAEGSGCSDTPHDEEELLDFSSFQYLTHLKLSRHIIVALFEIKNFEYTGESTQELPDLGPLMPPNLEVLTITGYFMCHPNTKNSDFTYIERLQNLLSTKKSLESKLKQIVLRHEHPYRINEEGFEWDSDEIQRIASTCREYNVGLICEQGCGCLHESHTTKSTVVVEDASS